jgi:uncharacterized oxidoreductase
MTVCPHKRLQRLYEAVWRAAGANSETAALVAQSFVEADLMGFDSHGIAMLHRYVEFIEIGWLDPSAEPQIETESDSTAVINGNWGFGQLAFHFAMRVAASKAQNTGTASVSVKNAGHCGRVGQYPQGVAEKGLIGITMVNNHGAGNMVAPFGGTERRLSTNPLAVAIPYQDGQPILLDMTTSVVAERKIKLKNLNGESVPAGWFITRDGNTPTDPSEFYGDPPGALLPFGGDVGYKGFGLSLVVDILSGALSGAGCSNPDASRVGNAGFGIAIDPSRFAPGSADWIEGLIRYVKSSATLGEASEIYYPGELEQCTRKRRLEEGVPVSDDVLCLVAEALTQLDLPLDLIVA